MIPSLFDKEDPTHQKVLKTTEVRETRFFEGQKYLLEKALTADFSFVKCQKADTSGNL